MPRILCVVTSHSEIDADHQTGLWLEEYARAFRIFRDGGYDVVTLSPHGGAVPIDPRSPRWRKRRRSGRGVTDHGNVDRSRGRTPIRRDLRSGRPRRYVRSRAVGAAEIAC